MVVLIVLCFDVWDFWAAGASYMFTYFSRVWVTEWPPIGKIAAHSAYDMFSWFK